jgi:hypothetical protein
MTLISNANDENMSDKLSRKSVKAVRFHIIFVFEKSLQTTLDASQAQLSQSKLSEKEVPKTTTCNVQTKQIV